MSAELLTHFKNEWNNCTHHKEFMLCSYLTYLCCFSQCKFCFTFICDVFGVNKLLNYFVTVVLSRTRLMVCLSLVSWMSLKSWRNKNITLPLIFFKLDYLRLAWRVSCANELFFNQRILHLITYLCYQCTKKVH